MMRGFFIIAAAILFSLKCLAQFPPQVGSAGSTAISRTDGLISAWANSCTIHRGLQDIAQPSLGMVTSGDSSLATGAADGYVVSLGDSGVAVLTFSQKIKNLPGPDFAVFENGFKDPTNPSMAFLELAFVEVSSDGINFFRFPATSNTQNINQIAGAGTYMDASLLHNLAGKYAATYGTPFDLKDLEGTAGLDANAISHVRIIDVVGAIDGYTSRDEAGNIINDPYPTPFATGGFDLDAVAVLNNPSSSVFAFGENEFTVYPNPASNFLTVDFGKNIEPKTQIFLTNAIGKIVWEGNAEKRLMTIPVESLPAGFYLLSIKTENHETWTTKVGVIH